jgi:hypothetical protein
LVEYVHSILARTRDGTRRLPSATDDDLLAGGLRNGKSDETGPDADGQYFHYHTMYMYALNRTSIGLSDKTCDNTAISLAKAVLPRFMTDTDQPRPRLYWKLPTELETPLVEGEGNLDAIRRYVSYRHEQRTRGKESTILSDDIALLRKIVHQKLNNHETADGLDIGMTLWTATLFPGDLGAQTLVERALVGRDCLVRKNSFRAVARAVDCIPRVRTDN